MLCKIQIIQWQNLSLPLIIDFCDTRNKDTSFWYKNQSRKIPRTIYIDGSIATGKSTIYTILQYIKDVALNKTINFVICHVILRIYFNSNIYVYELETDDKKIILEQIAGPLIVTNNNATSSIVGNTLLIDWFSSLMLFPSCFDNNNDYSYYENYNHSTNYYKINELLDGYKGYFYPNQRPFFSMSLTMINNEDFVVVNDKVNGIEQNYKIRWCHLPLSVRMLINHLELTDDIIHQTKNKVYVFDDADMIAKMIFLKIIDNRFSQDDSNFPVQFIGFINKKNLLSSYANRIVLTQSLL